MKRCPQCDAEYDDHVEYCFVDGAELVLQAGTRSAPLPPPPSTSPSARFLPVVLLLGGVAVIALIVIGVLLTSGDRDVAGTPPLPPPEPQTEVPDAPPTPTVSITSSPQGAQVWEGSTRLCERTPCEVEHPDHAPIPRLFSLRLSGFEDASLEMADVSMAYDVPLRRVRQVAPRGSGQATRPVSAPSIMDER